MLTDMIGRVPETLLRQSIKLAPKLTGSVPKNPKTTSFRHGNRSKSLQIGIKPTLAYEMCTNRDINTHNEIFAFVESRLFAYVTLILE